MTTYTADTIRNIGLFSHGGAGKTSLSEAMLFTSGAVNRLGRVEDGNTVSDWDPDEIKRGMSISTSVLPVEWHGQKINLLDTPGYADFVGEVKAAARVVDAAVILLDASAGVEVGTEFAWQYTQEHALPRLIVVNKIDRENANFETALASAQAAFGSSVVPLHYPIGQESSFRGVVDLLKQEALIFSESRDGSVTTAPIPEDLLDAVETYRLQLVEKIAENDEELMLKYLEDEPLSAEELRQALKGAIRSGAVVPVLVTAATTNRGVGLLLDALAAYAPCPLPCAAVDQQGLPVSIEPSPDKPAVIFVWKTVADPFVGRLSYFRVVSGTVKADSHLWNTRKDADERIGQIYQLSGKDQLATGSLGPGEFGAVSKLTITGTSDTLCEPNGKVSLAAIDFPNPLFTAAVKPRTQSDLDKMGQALQRITDEDPTIRVGRDPETGETLISGLGESHVHITLERMSRKFGVNVDSTLPSVPYRETVQSSLEKIEYKHKKQTGGHGQYGHVYISVEPSSERFEFAETIFGGSVPKQYVPAVEKGVREAMEQGVLAGFPVTNIKVTLTDGSYHTVDSSEMAFKLAASQAFKKAQQAANPVILEPINTLTVTIPDTYTGDVMGDLTTKRAHVTGMTPDGNGHTSIEATVPAAEIQRYATDLRSITQGRGSFSTAFSRYDVVPGHLVNEIVALQKAKQEAKS
jgi:elongation factor G